MLEKSSSNLSSNGYLMHQFHQFILNYSSKEDILLSETKKIKIYSYTLSIIQCLLHRICVIDIYLNLYFATLGT